MNIRKQLEEYILDMEKVARVFESIFFARENSSSPQARFQDAIPGIDGYD